MKKYVEFIKESNESPWIYEGNFNVTKGMVENGVMIKDKIPDVVKGTFNCSSLELTSLKNCPKEVGYDFICVSNYLTSLEFCPEIVGGNFDIYNNYITSLKHCPKEVREINCSSNKITSLEFCPDIVELKFYCRFNKLTSLEFAPKGGILNVSASYNTLDLKIEEGFIKKGYTSYWPDLLRYCIDNDIELERIESWPEGFLTDDNIKSAKGISKFDL